MQSKVLKLFLISLSILLTTDIEVVGQLRFSEQAKGAGLVARHEPSLATLLAMTAGVATADFNNDGWQDLYFVSGGKTPDSLYLNNGDGTFTNHTSTSGLSKAHLGHGIAVGDYDNDGLVDIFLTSLGSADQDIAQPGQHLLYHNEGINPNGIPVFSERARASQIHRTSIDDASGMGAAFGDYDLDGDLDLFVAAWLPTTHGNVLFQNIGDGTFANTTIRAGLRLEGVRGFAPRFADMDGDRYPELLLAADAKTSRYFINLRDGTFTDGTESSGTGIDANGMGHVTGDFDNNGFLDWYVTSVHGTGSYDVPWDVPPVPGTGNMLYMNQGNHSFEEISYSSGVNDGGWGWGVIAVDLDHDGRQDIVTTNGWPGLNSGGLHEWLDERTYVFHNNYDTVTKSLTFTEIGLSTGMEHSGQGRGLINLDYDNDGDQDIVIFDIQGNISLYRNELSGPNTHWIRFFLKPNKESQIAPNGRGAHVAIYVDAAWQYRYLDGGCNYLGSAELSAHFGLSSNKIVDIVLVTWPDGTTTELKNIAANQTLCINSNGTAQRCPTTIKHPA